MTRKKRRQLEEEERQRAEREQLERAQQAQQAQPTLYGAVNYGSVNGQALPVARGPVQGIQLPPIIQPIAFTFAPFVGEFGTQPSKQESDADDFDDYDGDDWF